MKLSGLALTQEELEFQEATRRSLIDVASWRAPINALPQLVIREPVEGAGKAFSGSVPRVGEQESLANLQMDSEEARIARERARKGKAVADEIVVLPPSGMIRTTVSRPEFEPALGLPHVKVNGANLVESNNKVGRGEVQVQPQAFLSLDSKLVTSVGSDKEFPSQNLQREDEEMKSIPHPNGGSKVNDGDSVLAFNLAENREFGPDVIIQNLKSSTNGTEENAELRIESQLEVPQPPRLEKTAIMEDSACSNVVVNPSFVKPNSDGTLAMDDMLKDAEEMDMVMEREELLSHEAAILAEREALASDEAELQAAFEKEQEELLAGIEKERELLFQEEAELREMQKKNERNADSVTSEMFSECQVYSDH